MCTGTAQVWRWDAKQAVQLLPLVIEQYRAASVDSVEERWATQNVMQQVCPAWVHPSTMRRESGQHVAEMPAAEQAVGLMFLRQLAP